MSRAFAAACLQLDANDRALLRLHYVEGVTTASLANMYGISRATLIRRLAAARESLVDGVKAALRADAGITNQDFDSVLTLSVGPGNVQKLKPKWTFTTQGDVSARAAVVGGGVYFPDWGGYLHRLNARTGAAVWSRNLVTDYGLSPAAGSSKVVSRTTPARL